jgi:hypothetical protein
MSHATFGMVCDALGAAVAKEDTTLRTAIPVPHSPSPALRRTPGPGGSTTTSSADGVEVVSREHSDLLE